MTSMRMEMRPTLGLHQKLAPRMIQSMEILQLPIVALQERIEQEMEKNPVLELREKDPDVHEPEEAPAEETFNPDAPIVHDADNENDFKRMEALDREWDGHFNEDHRPSRGAIDEAGDKKLDAMQNMPSRPQSLQDYLDEQIPFLDLSPDQHEAIEYLISNLDDRGYLDIKKTPFADLAAGFGKPITEDQLEDALNLLQKLDPPGVGARDLKECLLLQVTPDMPCRDVLRRIILDHLEDVACNRIPVIQKRTKYDVSAIKEAIEVLHRLDPKPGSRFISENTHFVVPDVIVEQNDHGEFDVRLTEDWIPSIRLNRRYMELFRDKDSDKVAKDYLRKNIQAAKWLLESIEQRRTTLANVTKAIISHQKAFLTREQDYIEPLKMQQVADQVHVHVTTVSRAVDDKWVQTSRRRLPLETIFWRRHAQRSDG